MRTHSQTRRLQAAAFITFTLALTAAASPALASENRPARPKISPRVLEEARAKSGPKASDTVDVLVRFRREPGKDERALLAELKGAVKRQFRASRWTSVRVPASKVAKLAEHPDVEFVASDPQVSIMMDAARTAAGIPSADVPESGFTGTGVTIALLDSGVAPHPEIPNVLTEVSFVSSEQTSMELGGMDPTGGAVQFFALEGIDPNGHGTHVAGIMVGNGSRSAEGRHAGIAPGAGLVSVRVLSETGLGSTSDVMAGLQWVADNKDLYGIRVLNLSLGHPVYEPAASDPLVQAVESLWDAGIVVVCSAGNAGRSGDATISSPCNARKVITVGASNDWNTAETADDTIATYSSRGPTRLDLVAKPDIVAPGNRIVSARSAGSYLDTLLPERRVAADPSQPGVFEHFEMSGTSMAAPMVAATAALMLEQDPSLNPGSVKARLMLSARKASAGNPFATGAGALDVLAALRTTGRVADAPSPLVFPDATTGLMGVENTAVLWSDEAYSLASLWSEAVLWSDTTQSAGAAVLWSYGVLWPDEDVSAYSVLWPDENVFPEATSWPDSTLWSESVLWPDEDATVLAETTLSADGICVSEAMLWPDGEPRPRPRSMAWLHSRLHGR
jgi:serine protease AprX